MGAEQAARQRIDAAALSFLRDRLYDDGLLRLPLIVDEGGKRTAVFAYPRAGGERQDALFVQARGTSRSWLLAQEYEVPQKRRPIATRGPLEPIAALEPLFPD